jgi:hypothetical protein
MLVPVWLAIELILLFNVAHCAAVIVAPADTVLTAVSPYPNDVAPVDQIPFILAALVLIKPL